MFVDCGSRSRELDDQRSDDDGHGDVDDDNLRRHYCNDHGCRHHNGSSGTDQHYGAILVARTAAEFRSHSVLSLQPLGWFAALLL
jgi:hypothetical protein